MAYTFAKNMKHFTLLLALSIRLMAADIIVIMPSEDLVGPTIESLDDGELLKVPKLVPMQENQLVSYTFNNIKPGRYRVSYSSLEPIGFHETLMETLVTVSESSASTVYLFRPNEHSQLKIPKNIEIFLTNHYFNLMELTLVYDGSKVPFMQAKGTAWAIRYLRDDCEYHLKVWNHSFRGLPKEEEPTIIFDKKFRTVDRDLDPFSLGGIPKPRDNQSEQAAPRNR